MTFPAEITITEVGPRDGLQNEPEALAVADKIRFIDQLSQCGLREIEATACVSPRWVPQLADAMDVLAGIERRPGVTYSALVPNLEGWQRARDAGVDKIAVFTAASETFSTRNTNASITETLDRFAPVVRAAHDEHRPVRGYISCAVACPFEGPVSPAAVVQVVRGLLDIGIDEIDLGDTIGQATPAEIDRLLDAVEGIIPIADLVLHLHDTRGTAVACAYRALQRGVGRFDSSCGGLGGCPYAPGATGNLATGDLDFLCRGLGIETGIEAAGLFKAAGVIEAALGRPLPGRVYRASTGS